VKFGLVFSGESGDCNYGGDGGRRAGLVPKTRGWRCPLAGLGLCARGGRRPMAFVGSGTQRMFGGLKVGKERACED